MEMFSFSYVNGPCICLEICLSSRFMSTVLWPGWLTLCQCYLKMHVVGEGPGATPSVLRHFLSLISSLLIGFNSLLKTSKAAFILSPSDVYVRSFFYLFYALIKLYYTKSSERSRLISGPRLNYSPLEAKNPGIFHGSATTFHFGDPWTSYQPA